MNRFFFVYICSAAQKTSWNLFFFLGSSSSSPTALFHSGHIHIWTAPNIAFFSARRVWARGEFDRLGFKIASKSHSNTLFSKVAQPFILHLITFFSSAIHSQPLSDHIWSKKELTFKKVIFTSSVLWFNFHFHAFKICFVYSVKLKHLLELYLLELLVRRSLQRRKKIWTRLSFLLGNLFVFFSVLTTTSIFFPLV